MARVTARTDRTDCHRCGARVIIARGIPPLNWAPDPAGTVAAEHLASGAWRAWWLATGENAAAPAKRYRVHFCEETGEPHGTAR